MVCRISHFILDTLLLKNRNCFLNRQRQLFQYFYGYISHVMFLSLIQKPTLLFQSLFSCDKKKKYYFSSNRSKKPDCHMTPYFVFCFGVFKLTTRTGRGRTKHALKASTSGHGRRQSAWGSHLTSLRGMAPTRGEAWAGLSGCFPRPPFLAARGGTPFPRSCPLARQDRGTLCGGGAVGERKKNK